MPRRLMDGLMAVFPRSQGLIAKCRWLVLAAVILNAALTLPILLGHFVQGSSLAPVGAVALLGLLLWWVRGYRRGRFAPLSPILEGMGLFLFLLGVTEPTAVLNMVRGGVFYRALFGSARGTLVSSGTFVVAYLLSLRVFPEIPNGLALYQMLAPVVGLPVAALVLQFLATTITRHEETEAALREAVRAHEETLRAKHESERQLQVLLDNLPGVAYQARYDGHWTMTLVSDGCLVLTGHTPGDLLGRQSPGLRGLIHAEDRQHVDDLLADAIREGRSCQMTYRIVAANGDEKWVWEQARGVPASDGAANMVEGFIADVTERKRLEVEQAERARLDGAMITARTVAHEINNDLSPILGYAELIASSQPSIDDPMLAEGLRLIGDYAVRAAEKVRLLQRIVRLEERASPLGADQPMLDLNRSTVNGPTPIPTALAGASALTET